MHSGENTAVRGWSWPDFWADTVTCEVLRIQWWASLNSAENAAVKFQHDLAAGRVYTIK